MLLNSLTINFDTIKDMVINNRDDVKTVKDDFKITRDQKRLLTVHQDKDYRMVFDKRVIMVVTEFWFPLAWPRGIHD
jgi:hypothetical protein